MPAADKVLESMAAGQAANCAPPEGTARCPLGRVRIGVFYDGTGNSIYRDWPNGEADHVANPVKMNGPTNVAKLWKLFDEHLPVQKRVYHHGVGTDSTIPLMGKTPGLPTEAPTKEVHSDFAGEKLGSGGKARVQWGVDMCSVFFSSNNNQMSLEKLIDSFGFSRGAAIARDFINTVETQGLDDTTKPNGKKYKATGGGRGGTRVREIITYERHHHVFHEFLGAFDTVASFGTAGAEIGNDLAGYNFYVNHKVVRRSVHMMAEDERRLLFPVSSFFMDPSEWLSQDRYKYKSVMQEVWYPGVHSDVGGSYLLRPGTPGKPEQKRTVSIRGGRYTVTDPAVPPGPDKKPELAHIPLHDMHKIGKKSGVPFLPLPNDKLHRIPGDLAKMYADYCAYREGRRYDNGKTYIHNLSHVEFVTCFYVMREHAGQYTPLRDAYIHNENMFFDVPHLQRKVLYMAPQPKD